jgi:hypothetical protein
VENLQFPEIQDEWCREMVRQASLNVEEIAVQITMVWEKRLSRPPPREIEALDREIAILPRIREELASDIQNWMGNSTFPARDEHPADLGPSTGI